MTTTPHPTSQIHSSKPRRLSIGLALTFCLAACANFSGIEPTAKLRDPASLGIAIDAATLTPAVDIQWWRALGDAQLNALIDQALADNPSLKQAQARLARAQSGFEVTDSTNGPQINGALDLTRQRYTANGAVPPPLAGSVLESGTLQLTASWELDFFNKNRSALNAALGQVNTAKAEAQAARLLLASNVARTYIKLARLNEQLTVAQRTLEQREQLLRLVTDRVKAGLDTRLELRQSEGSLPEARLQIEILQEEMMLQRNALAALAGQRSLVQTLQTPTLQGLKHMSVASSLPADLLGRRAEVAAARWRVETAIEDANHVKAQFYPNINLVAFAGFSSIGLNRLLDSSSQQWGVGPALRLPIFDNDRLRASLRGKTADVDAAVESYNATVLEAIRDAADQIASSNAITRQQAQQRTAQVAAEQAFEVAVQRYKAGLSNYLSVLNAETSILNQRRSAVDLQARALDTDIALIRALGGGYTEHNSVAMVSATTAKK